MKDRSIYNAFTIDVEDYYQVSAFSDNITRAEWPQMESRVVRNTEKILNHLDTHNIKATFFVLGWVAERQQSLVKNIHDQGHEVACHGYSHQLIYNQSREEFKEETLKAKNILEDIIQAPVNGYRAASYSITKKSLWAIDILADAGFKYDSSVYPVVHDRYGIPGSKEQPYKLTSQTGNMIIEFPLSVYKFMKYNIPISGGGYFRLFPYKFTQFSLFKHNDSGNPFVFYLHPWEIDTKQPRIKTNFISRFRHYNNLHKCENRLLHLLNDFKFTRMDEVLNSCGYKI